MPEKETLRRVRRDKQQGKAPTTQAGEFIREEIHHIRESKHGARSAKQAIAIGLSKARRSGVELAPPKQGATSAKTRKSAARAYARGHGAAARRPASKKRAAAAQNALKREGAAAASHTALARQAHEAAHERTSGERSQSARAGARTKGSARRSMAARKAAQTREGRSCALAR